MKKVSIIGLSFLSVLTIATVLFFQSCNTDECKDVVCLNGGACVAGVCVCDAGYEGTDCGTESRAKFIGNYTVNDNCSTSGTSSYNVSVNNGTAVTNVNITNFWDAFNNVVIASVDGNDITIALQEPDSDGFTVQGSGTISGNTISWNYTITDTGTSQTDICTATWVM